MSYLFAFLISLNLFRPDSNIQAEPKSLNILTIGDSNGAIENGWPEQLRKLLPGSLIINKSISGNTIGFDNLGKESLNTLKNIRAYLDDATKQLSGHGELDYILICVGTNDTKQVFAGQQAAIPENMSKLISLIKEYFLSRSIKLPGICIITPPPMDENKIDKGKYGGGDERIQKNNGEFKKIAKKNHVDFLDTYKSLKEGFALKTTDGVHLNGAAQAQMTEIIKKYLTL
jgi:lysophospholipase L1-like esterase